MQLYQHQRDGVTFADARPRAGYFADCGTGKTVLTLAICDRRPRSTLVLAPLQVMRDAWQADAQRFFPDLPLHVHHGPKRWRDLGNSPQGAIVLTTHETFRRDSKRLLDELSPERLVVDESSKCKNRDSQTAKAAIAAADRCDEVYILTGTPATEGDDSAYWSQLRILDPRTGGLADAPGATQGVPSFYRWAGYYCSPVEQWIYNKRKRQREKAVVAWRLRPDRREEFERRLSSLVMRIDKSECLDLPEKTVQRLHVDLDRDGLDAYTDLLDGFMPDGEDRVEAQALARKLHQVTGGVLSTGAEWVDVGSAKIKALLEKAGELQGAPFIVWIQYQAEARRVQAELSRAGIRSGVCNGEAGPRRTQENVAAFKAGKLQALVCHPQTVGHGITLTSCGDRPCSTAIYYSLGWSYELHHQSMERIYRAGQRMPCTYYLMVATGTIDEDIVESLEHKQDATDRVMASLLRRQKSMRVMGGAA